MTKFPKVGKRTVHSIDARGVSVGRLASQCAKLLLGKHRVDYAPHIDCGDVVEVRHLSEARWTGNKMSGKVYYAYSGYPGGLKATRLGKLWTRKPEQALQSAIFGMLPKTRHRRAMMKRLRIQ